MTFHKPQCGYSIAQTVNGYPIFVANALCSSEGKTTCKLLDEELQLEPVHLCEFLGIFCSDAKLLLEGKETESVLHVSATEKRMHPLWVKYMEKPSAREGFRRLHLCHGPDVH